MKHPAKTTGSECLICLDQVIREVEGPKQEVKRLLDRISWTLNEGERVAVLSRNRAHADAFLECVSGISSVQAGSVAINVNISWPLGDPGSMPSMLSARQNAEFLQKIYGDPRAAYEQMQLIQELSRFDGDFFDRPMKLYNKYMKARFRLAVSLAFDFDAYAVPRMPAWPYSSKSPQCRRFRRVFEKRIAGKTIVVSHPDFNFQKEYCDRGIVLEEGAIIFKGDVQSCQDLFTSKKKNRKK